MTPSTPASSGTLTLFATAARGLEELVVEELSALGATAVRQTRAGVHFSGDLGLAYRVCLWSRLASRVLLPLAEFPARTADELYDGVRSLDWEAHLGPDHTLAFDVAGRTDGLHHGVFAAQRAKDALCDGFQERRGRRPSVELQNPDLRFNLHLHDQRCTVSLDLSGGSLHRRGYRDFVAEAPLKESLAAAILLRAGWPRIAASGGPLIDPMCGSGTLVLEGALMAGDMAPGLMRPHHGFLRWRQHRADIWASLLAEARERKARGSEALPPLFASDLDGPAVTAARHNIERAGLSAQIRLHRADMFDLQPPEAATPGLLAVNPPYGERLGNASQIVPLYVGLGRTLRRFRGYRAAVLLFDKELGFHLGLRADRVHRLYNGPLPCSLLCFQIPEDSPESVEKGGKHRISTKVMKQDMPIASDASRSAEDQSPGAGSGPDEGAAEAMGRSGGQGPRPGQSPEEARAFADRLRKNLRRLSRWTRQQGVTCYRLYDADLPQFALAIDLYQARDRLFAEVQEYEAPPEIPVAVSAGRLRQALTELPGVLGVSPAQVFLKVRRRRSGGRAPEPQGGRSELLEVREGPCRLYVNLGDYLDTGLFLDHRPLRRLIHERARGRSFLNLFCYTASASVHAALGGAKGSLSLDLSRTYLDWAEKNLRLNHLNLDQHRLERADCLSWLERASQTRGRNPRYSLILLDPPTFSNSNTMHQNLDIQRDHVRLIQQAATLLEPEGVLFFSTNNRRFRLDADALRTLSVQDITRSTLDPDFARSRRIHQCFKITLK